MLEQDRSNGGRDGVSNVRGLDYIELYVGNARHAAHFFRTAYGLEPTAYAGPETGVRDRISIVVEHRGIRLVLTSAVSPGGPVAEHFAVHGEGVKDIGLRCVDARAAFDRAVSNGAEPVSAPREREDALGRVVTATVATFGATVHTFVERDGYDGPFLPSYVETASAGATRPTGLASVDHLAIAVEPGQARRWVEYYRKTLGLSLSQQEDVYSDFSGMSTHVVRDDRSGIVFVIVEPAPSKRRSPLEEYLAYNEGAGVHHIAVTADDILETVAALRANGVEFASTPDAYFDALGDRVGPIDQSVAKLRSLNVLVDRDEWGYLLQIFAKPMQSRPTFFFEIIQRVDARGFGNGNIKALYEAIEREQALRGNA